ncbi:MAG: hypothetical protein QXW00_04190 [Candidatus Woesearchaeota archaeon]
MMNMSEYEAKLEIAKQILESLCNKELSHSELEDMVYDFFRVRKSREEKSEFLNNYDSYKLIPYSKYGFARNIDKKKCLSREDNYWLRFLFNHKSDFHYKIPKQGSDIELYYKAYFTLKAENPEEFKKNYERLGMALPEIIAFLYALGIVNKDEIQAKVSNNPYKMYTTRDNLVVHCRKPETVKQAIAGINHILEKYGTTIEIHHGFDFYNNGSKFEGSHTQLISRIISRRLLMNIDDYTLISPENLASFILSQNDELSRMSPLNLYAQLKMTQGENFEEIQ